MGALRHDGEAPDVSLTGPRRDDAAAPRGREELTGALERIEDDDDTTSASPDLAALVPPPDRANTLAELVFVPGTRAGRGLFGASDVWITETPSPVAGELLTRGHEPPTWTLPPAPRTTRAMVKAGDREITCAVRRVRPGEEDEA